VIQKAQDYIDESENGGVKNPGGAFGGPKVGALDKTAR
jgi:hypothetical protein